MEVGGNVPRSHSVQTLEEVKSQKSDDSEDSFFAGGEIGDEE